jgi:YD repeat-containing protein
MDDAHEPPSDLVCSARGCGAPARWGLRWNNPKLHTPDRRKTWLACDAHRQLLSDHLSARGFLRETVPSQDLAATR